MADTRKSIVLNATADHATWLAALAGAYPRLSRVLLASRPCFVTATDYTTLTGLTDFNDGDPASDGLVPSVAGDCAFAVASQRAHSNFAALS